MRQKKELFHFTGLRQPVAFINSEALYPHLFSILRDWGMKKIDPCDEMSSVITIQKTESAFWRRSKWTPKPVFFRNAVDAACDLVVDLIHAYVAENDGWLCLHCAAVEFKRGLVVFPNTYRAGKSLLSLKLVSGGARLFTDDVLPVIKRSDFGMALGILPRLRLPLPEDRDKTFVNFVSDRVGPQNSRYLYVKLASDEQAVMGTAIPIRGITILQRMKNAEPALLQVKKSIVVKDMILRNFARRNPAVKMVDRIYSIVSKAECYALRYQNLDQAMEILDDKYGLQTK